MFLVPVMFAMMILLAPTSSWAGKEETRLASTVVKISKTTWALQDLKKQGLKESHKEVSAKIKILKSKRKELKELLKSGVKPDSVVIAETGETLLKYSKRRKMPADVVKLLKDHGATK